MKRIQSNLNYKTGISFLFFLCCILACGEKETDLSFPDRIENERTPEHIHIEGTHLSIIPPVDFNYWREQRAFYNITKSDSALVIIQENQLNYYDYLPEVLSQYHQSDMEIRKEEPFILNGIEGTFLHLIEDESYRGYRILMGDSATTIFVMATYPAQNQRMRKELFDSLLTLYPEKE